MGGSFNAKHFFDPLGLTFGKGQGGGAANFWDPANIFTPGHPAATTPAAPVAMDPPPTYSKASTGAADAQWAAQQRRKSMSATIYAGNTGGWGAPSVGSSATKTG